MLLPSIAVKPLLQCKPPSVLYSTNAPLSTPITDRVPTLVILSVPVPVVPEPKLSVASATVGVRGNVVSIVKIRLPELLVLSATSVCRTRTLLLPSPVVKLPLHVEPLSVEYSMMAPGSIPVRFKVPILVTLSVLLMPVSLVRATPGATT